MLQLREAEVVIMDMEAGIEHFGRGTGNSTDAVLMVVDPSYINRHPVKLPHRAAL